jgi:hypothetical protein
MPQLPNTIKKQKGRVITQPGSGKHQMNGPHESPETIKAIDFDGTLAKEVKPYNPKEAGPPIKSTIKLVKQWMKDREKIVIFTSRVCSTAHTITEIRYARKLITAWCRHYLGKSFPITAEKHPKAIMYDNRAHRIETNTGKILAQENEKV